MKLKEFPKKIWKQKWRILAAGALIGAFLFIFPNVYIPMSSAPYIYEEAAEVPDSQAALILGARVYSSGAISDIFKDRLLTGLDLYQNGQVEKLLVSGDNGQEHYDEVNAAKDFLLSQGIPEQDIFLDHAGFDTYDSIYRAEAIFQVETVTIVTQEFHLPRAVYIAPARGLETTGIIADRQPYQAARYNSLRESLARVKAFLNVTFRSKPKFLGEQIPITGDGRTSWD